MNFNSDNIIPCDKRTCGDSQSIIGIITYGIVRIFVEGSIIGKASVPGDFRAIYVNSVGIVIGYRDGEVYECRRVRNIG